MLCDAHPTLQKVLLIGLLALFTTSQAGLVSAGTNVWTSNGPEGGTIYALAIDPATPATLYAGTWGGGVFKSTNGGGNWSAVNTGLTNTTVRALAIDPVTPATLYAGTDGGGVFKSTNGGANWSAANTGLTDTYVRALAIDPVTPATLYAGTRGRRVQEHERRRELERGQHRPDRSLVSRPGDRPEDAGHPLCGD